VLSELFPQGEDRVTRTWSINHDDQHVVLIIDTLPLDLPPSD
jgi:hypothetical protein